MRRLAIYDMDKTITQRATWTPFLIHAALARKDVAELYSLSNLGIASINLDAQQASELNNGNWIGLSGSYETLDGQVHSMVDAWFRSGEAGQTIDLTALNLWHECHRRLHRQAHAPGAGVGRQPLALIRASGKCMASSRSSSWHRRC